ncbi:MAG: metallophosphoesterase [Bacteroidetes bacterium]|nr:metallophosphoesterase [Bacteroidota bacterium]
MKRIHTNVSKQSLVIALLGITFFSGCISARNAREETFSFIQMSDPQFGFFNENRSFEKETQNFTKAIQEANRLRPSFVIVTGDLVNRPFDTAQVRAYRSIIGGIAPGIPLYSVAGNHDVGNTPSLENIMAYNKEFGPDFYSFTKGPMLGIVLNSLYLSAPNNVKEKALEQESWLIRVLDSARQEWKRKQIMVFLHHPLFLETPNEKDGYFNIPLLTRKRYLSIFKKYGIRYVFAGHYHRNAFGKGSGIHMITTGPVGKPLGKDPSGFRIVTIKGKQVRHNYYDLNAVPDQLDQIQERPYTEK